MNVMNRDNETVRIRALEKPLSFIQAIVFPSYDGRARTKTDSYYTKRNTRAYLVHLA
jgi:hypothetical protein